MQVQVLWTDTAVLERHYLSFSLSPREGMGIYEYWGYIFATHQTRYGEAGMQKIHLYPMATVYLTDLHLNHENWLLLKLQQQNPVNGDTIYAQLVFVSGSDTASVTVIGTFYLWQPSDVPVIYSRHTLNIIPINALYTLHGRRITGHRGAVVVKPGVYVTEHGRRFVSTSRP